MWLCRAREQSCGSPQPRMQVCAFNSDSHWASEDWEFNLTTWVRGHLWHHAFSFSFLFPKACVHRSLLPGLDQGLPTASVPERDLTLLMVFWWQDPLLVHNLYLKSLLRILSLVFWTCPRVTQAGKLLTIRSFLRRSSWARGKPVQGKCSPTFHCVWFELSSYKLPRISNYCPLHFTWELWNYFFISLQLFPQTKSCVVFWGV